MKIQDFEFYPDYNDHGPFLDGRAVQTGVAVYQDGTRKNTTLLNGKVYEQGPAFRRVKNDAGLWTNVLA